MISAEGAARPVDGFDRFAHPDAWHSPAAYWFWHRTPSDDEVRDQVARMRAAGFRSFQVQARLSYPLAEYLGIEHLRAMRTAVEAAAGAGMIVGIYDDYNWQSGHAAGRAVAGHDELRERHLFWARVPLHEGKGRASVSGIRSATENLGPGAMAWHYEGGVPRWSDWRVEHVITGAAPAARDVPSAALVSPAGDGCDIRVMGVGVEAESALVLVSARCATSRFVNPLDPDAVARFVDAAYEPFASALGEHFGRTVRYMFFDQPHAVYYDWAERAGDPRSALPYHASLGDALRERFGANLADVLLSVIDGDASGAAQRAAFWETASAHSIETFLGPVRDWSHAHGLLQSGHEVLSHVGSWIPGDAFDNWELRANLGLDHFAIDRFRDLTAADAQDAVAQLGPVLADSVARASGRSRAMVEQYFMTPPPGGAPWSGHWGLTLDELRETAIRHHFGGMRQMIFHGFHQTDGHARDHESLVNPRFDFPPGINHEPWFDEGHAAYADEDARLSEFLDGMAQETEAALLWPLRTFWSHGQQGPHADGFGSWAKAFAQAGVAYRVIDESGLGALAEASGIAAVVLPDVRTLAGPESVRALADAAGAGIRIVTSGTTPDSFLRDADAARAAWRSLPSRPVDTGDVASVLPELGTADNGFARAAARFGAIARHGAGPDGRIRLALFHGGDAPIRVELPAGAEEWDQAAASRRRADGMVLSPGDLRLVVVPVMPKASAITDAPPAKQVRELSAGWNLRLVSGRRGGDGLVPEEERPELPIAIASGWQEAYPDFSGRASYRTRIDSLPDRDLILRFPAVVGAVEVTANGHRLGKRGWRPYRFRVPHEVQDSGAIDLVVDVSGTAANAFYAGTGLRQGPEPDGIVAVPVLEEETPC